MVIGYDASRAFIGQKTGTERYSYELLKELLLNDQKNYYNVYLRNGEGEQDPILDRPNLTKRPINLSKLWTQVGLAAEVFFHKPDVLLIPAHTLPVIHRSDLRSVVVIHDLGAEYLPQYHQFPQKLYLNRSTEYAVRFATHLIAVSQATKQDLVKRLGANPDKITVVYEGFGASCFQPQPRAEIRRLRKKCGVNGDYLLFVGTVQPRKNLERLIEAFARVIPAVKMREKEELILVIAGKNGWLSEQIYQAPAKFGIFRQVKFINYVDDRDLPALYAGALAFVLPSLYEGFGIPVLEAMACGTPVLTSWRSSLPEVAGKAAYYIDPTDIGSIAQGISRLVTDPNLRSQLRALGFEQVKQFSWQKCAQETLTVLETVAQGGRQ